MNDNQKAKNARAELYNELTDDEQAFLKLIHETPRQDLERRLERLGLLDSFRRAEGGV